MGLLPKSPRDPSISIVAYALAAGIPFAAYVATASAHAYWLDAGELVAAAAQLDIAHPPGHPLASLIGHAATLVPLGPIALRVAIAQALCAAIAAAFLFGAIETTVRAMDVRHDRLSIPIALGASWLVACSHALWIQAVRPEVYALEAMLVAIAIERVVRLEAAWPTHDVRPLYVAGLAIGLGLANHHFMAVLVLPALAPTMARVYRARGSRSLFVALGAVGFGLLAYAYLPVRSRTDPPIDLGDPSSLERFFWVVSARAFQHADRHSLAAPIDRAGEVAIAIVENVHLVPLVLAIAGVYALLRTPGARRIGFVWIAVVGFALAGRSWMGHTSGNPDALGYLVPAFMGLAALAAALVAAIVAQLAGSPDRRPPVLVTALAIVMALLGLATIGESRKRSTLASFHATDDLDEPRIRALPARAVVIAHLPQTVFRHWELEATEAARPDVTLVPIPFLGYPGMIERVIERDPSIAELLRGYLLEGELRQPDLQSLAARRPILVEMDVRVPIALYETLAPALLYYEVVDAGTTETDVREAAEQRSLALRALDRALDDDRDDPETRAQIVWIHYGDALYYAQLGAIDRARESVRRARALAPEARELVELDRRLSDPELEGPIDVTPFVVGP